LKSAKIGEFADFDVFSSDTNGVRIENETRRRVLVVSARGAMTEYLSFWDLSHFVSFSPPISKEPRNEGKPEACGYAGMVCEGGLHCLLGFIRFYSVLDWHIYSIAGKQPTRADNRKLSVCPSP